MGVAILGMTDIDYSYRRGGRAVECTGLENRQGLIALRGFESHPLRHYTATLAKKYLSIDSSAYPVQVSQEDIAMWLRESGFGCCNHLLITLITAFGLLSTILSNTRAVPLGTRSPCSQ